VSTLYRSDSSHGWLEDTGRDRRNERKWRDLGWRRATRYERLWHAFFWAELSWAQYAGLATVLLFVHDNASDTLEMIVWMLVGVPVSMAIVGLVKFLLDPPRPWRFVTGIWDGLREVLHNHGRHRLCREITVQVYDHTEYDAEFIDGPHGKVDVTMLGGRRVYRSEKRHG